MSSEALVPAFFVFNLPRGADQCAGTDRQIIIRIHSIIGAIDKSMLAGLLLHSGLPGLNSGLTHPASTPGQLGVYRKLLTDRIPARVSAIQLDNLRKTAGRLS